MATLNNILDYVDMLYPNTLSVANKIEIINRVQRYIFKYMATEGIYGFDSIINEPFYSLESSDCTIDLIKNVEVAATTLPVTTATVFIDYKFAGRSDNLENGYYFYDAYGTLGLYPIPDKSGYSVRIIYDKRPIILASSDGGTTLNLEADFISYIEKKTCAEVAKCGSYPDVEMANNFEADSQEFERRLKMDWYKRRAKNPDKTWSYKNDWDC